MKNRVLFGDGIEAVVSDWTQDATFAEWLNERVAFSDKRPLSFERKEVDDFLRQHPDLVSRTGRTFFLCHDAGEEEVYILSVVPKMEGGYNKHVLSTFDRQVWSMNTGHKFIRKHQQHAKMTGNAQVQKQVLL